MNVQALSGSSSINILICTLTHSINNLKESLQH